MLHTELNDAELHIYLDQPDGFELPDPVRYLNVRFFSALGKVGGYQAERGIDLIISQQQRTRLP